MRATEGSGMSQHKMNDDHGQTQDGALPKSQKKKRRRTQARKGALGEDGMLAPGTHNALVTYALQRAREEGPQ